jgi:hypothetical protein
LIWGQCELFGRYLTPDQQVTMTLRPAIKAAREERKRRGEARTYRQKEDQPPKPEPQPPDPKPEPQPPDPEREDDDEEEKEYEDGQPLKDIIVAMDQAEHGFSQADLWEIVSNAVHHLRSQEGREPGDCSDMEAMIDDLDDLVRLHYESREPDEVIGRAALVMEYALSAASKDDGVHIRRKGVAPQVRTYLDAMFRYLDRMERYLTGQTPPKPKKGKRAKKSEQQMLTEAAADQDGGEQQ